MVGLRPLVTQVRFLSDALFFVERLMLLMHTTAVSLRIVLRQQACG